MTYVARDYISSLSSHLHSLDEVKEGVMRAFQRNVGHQLGMTREHTIHWVDIVGCEAIQVSLLMSLRALIYILQAYLLIQLPLSSRLRH